MSLRKPSTTPAFEAEETGSDSAVETVATAEVHHEDPIKTAPQEQVEAASEKASTAIARAQTSSVSTQVGSKFQAAYQGFKNVIDPSGLDFDTFPRITVGLDGFSDPDEEVVGKKLKFRLMSYNERWIVTPGVDNDEANKLVKYSLDGVTIDETGESVTDYIARLRDVEGYADASKKKYYSLYGFIAATADTVDGDFEEIPEDEQQLVAIQVPPRSVAKFTGFQIEQGVKIARGVIEETDVVVMRQNKVKGSKTTYAEILFSAK